MVGGFPLLPYSRLEMRTCKGGFGDSVHCYVTSNDEPPGGNERARCR